MTEDTIQKRTASSWIVCQKCKSPESAAEEDAEPPTADTGGQST